MTPVAVIGAGMAGLAAARRLVAAGLRPVVLEAAARPGGRACTLALSEDLKLELGATWFHGLRALDGTLNPVLEAAVTAGLCSPAPPPQRWWESTWLLPGTAAPLDEGQVVAVTRALAAFTETVEGLQPGSTGSIAAHLASAWAGLQKQQHELESGGACRASDASGLSPGQVAARAWAWRERLQRAMDGCRATEDMSATGLALYEDFGEVHAPLGCGFQVGAADEWPSKGMPGLGCPVGCPGVALCLVPTSAPSFLASSLCRQLPRPWPHRWMCDTGTRWSAWRGGHTVSPSPAPTAA